MQSRASLRIGTRGSPLALVQARMVRFATVSPNGQRVVYESFGRLWIRDIGGGGPRKIKRELRQ